MAQIGNPNYSTLGHGVRRGEEIRYFSYASIEKTVGADLYVPPYADSRIVRCNMSKPHQVFDSRFDVVYHNSIDHAQNPVQTLLVWAARHLSARIVLELEASHRACGSSDLDVSGLDLQSFPFFLFIKSDGALYCDRIVKSTSFPVRFFYYISRGTGNIAQ